MAMHWDGLLLGIPFQLVMFVGIFRLDELIAAPKTKNKVRRHTHQRVMVSETGEFQFSDPDGRRWEARPAHKL